MNSVVRTPSVHCDFFSDQAKILTHINTDINTESKACRYFEALGYVLTVLTLLSKLYCHSFNDASYISSMGPFCVQDLHACRPGKTSLFTQRQFNVLHKDKGKEQ